MRTDQILNISCKNKEGKKNIDKFLRKIPEIKKRVTCNDEYVSLDVLEDVFKYFCVSFNYRIQGIKPYVENDRFVFYNVCVTKRDVREGSLGNKWIKTVYGLDMWEVFAKMIVAIYDDYYRCERGGESNDKSKRE